MAKRRRSERRPRTRQGESGGAGPRQLRVGELLRQALAEVLTRETIRDAVLSEVAVTVTEVRAAPDLRHATCFVMPLGGERAPEVMAALGRLAPWLSGQVARRVQLRYAPALGFQLDPSFDEAERIAALLRRPEVARDLAGGEDGGDGG